MNVRHLLTLDRDGRYHMHRNISNAPKAVRGVRVEYGEMYSCPECTRGLLVAGYDAEMALRYQQPFGLPCRCGNTINVSASGVVE